MIPPILLRRAIHSVMKDPGKITAGAETAVLTDSKNTVAGLQQHLGGHADPVIIQVVDRRYSNTALETPCAFAVADISRICNTAQCQTFHVVFVNVLLSLIHI